MITIVNHKVCFGTKEDRAARVCSSLVFLNVSPTLSRSHTLCGALQKLEPWSRAPSRLCTLDTRGCRSRIHTQWASHSHKTLHPKLHEYRTKLNLTNNPLMYWFFFFFKSMAFFPTRWRCQRDSITWWQRFEEEAPTRATFSSPTNHRQLFCCHLLFSRLTSQ